LTTLHTLANAEHTLAAQEGRPATEALTLHERALAARRRVLGPGHPDTIASLNDVADALRDFAERDPARANRDPARADRARKAYEETLESSRRFLGADHPRTLTIMNDYAVLLTLLRGQGDLERSEALLREALGRGRRVRPLHQETHLSWRH